MMSVGSRALAPSPLCDAGRQGPTNHRLVGCPRSGHVVEGRRWDQPNNGQQEMQSVYTPYIDPQNSTGLL